MKARLFAALLASASGLLGQYVYDFPGLATPSQYTSNGGWQYSYDGSGNVNGVFLSNSSGSLMLNGSVSGNSNDYEVLTLLSSSGATARQFLRASSTAVQLGTGSYISVELTTSTGQLVVNQCISGTVTQIGGTTVAVSGTMRLRSVIFGTTLWVLANTGYSGMADGQPPPATNPDVLVWSQQVPATMGIPGFGGAGVFLATEIGHHVTAAPNPVPQSGIATLALPNQVSFKWPNTTDVSSGPGLLQYVLYRNGVAVATVPVSSDPGVSDDTLSPSTEYSYQLGAQDSHGNTALTSFSLTTPPASAIDPRRIGVQPNGSYWGGGGEQIDTLSGNLNFGIPLTTVPGRNGTSAAVNLTYNSQNWMQNSGVNWNLGSDTNAGYGWKVQVGSLTPYYYQWSSGVDHYVFSDTTGAQYTLSVNNSGVWTSTQSNYVWYNANNNQLYFRDGSFWVMGCTSFGAEPDAGTMYPTMDQDVEGNQIVLTYLPSITLTSGSPNTSSRLTYVLGPTASAWLRYNSDTPFPHLQYVNTSTGDTYTFTYAYSAALGPPFGTDSNYAGDTTTHLASIAAGTASPYQFSYDSAGAGELTSVVFPFGGELSWNYSSFIYSGANGGRILREISSRSLTSDSSHSSTPWAYTITRPDASNSVTIHSAMTLADASGVGAKTWNFNTSASPLWQLGLLASFVQSASAGGTVMQQDTYTWTQDAAGNPYISAKTSVKDPATANVQITTTQTLDQYGNVTQSVLYPLNNTSSPLQTYNNTYLTGSGYLAANVVNRLVSSSVTTASGTQTLVTNYYDGACPSPAPSNCPGSTRAASGITAGHSWNGTTWVFYSGQAPYYYPEGAAPTQSQGLVTYSVNPAVSMNNMYYEVGSLYQTTRSDGTTSTSGVSSSTSFSAPSEITTESYSGSFGYNDWLGMTQATGANGESVDLTYDAAGRPTASQSVYGANTTYTYSAAGTWPATLKTTIDSSYAYTLTTYDGLGRAIRVETGTTSPSQALSWTDTVYAPCACSPLGKIQKVSQPYTPGGTPVWTVNAYDGLGRTLSVTQPDGASTTTYAYSGTQTTVTDPAGNWKQMTTDAVGNLTTVVEPDPANQPGGTLTTSYTYDWMKHVTGVSMPRGSTTQTRTFVYDTQGRLTSATNPENGTVTYTYNTSTNTLQDKHDAKGADTVYTYDSKNRLTEVQHYPTGVSNAEDTCQRVTYTWDSFSSSYTSLTSVNATNRIAAIAYGITWASGCVPDEGNETFTEVYAYNAAGEVTAKEVYLSNSGLYDDCGDLLSTWHGTQNFEVTYSYNGNGQVATEAYPEVSLVYTFDAMGRPATMKSGYLASDGSTTNWVQGITYDAASRATSLQYMTSISDDGNGNVNRLYTTEAKSFNTNGQLTSLSWSGSSPSLNGGLTYGYSSTQNSGQITQMTDTLSEETVTYQYL